MTRRSGKKAKGTRLGAALMAALMCFVSVISFLPAKRSYAADKVMTLKTARSLALANSSAYESAQMNVDSKQAARESALKSLKLKQKNMSTFRWSPLLNFKFPTKPDFAEASEFQFKPIQLSSDIDVAQHKVQDTVFSVNEQVNNLFVEIVTTQETLAFNEQRLQTLNDGIAHNKARVKLGEAKQADVDRQQKKADTLSNTIASNRRTLEADLKKMSGILGVDVTTGYTFEKPYVEARIDRSSLPQIIDYAEDRDETYYEASAKATTAKAELNTNYGLMKSKYGNDINIISSYVNAALNGQDISARAFKNSYKSFLDKIDSYWKGKKRIFLFIKIPREWLKGDLDGTRYIEDDPYTLYQNALDYVSARKDEEAARKDLDQQVEDSFNSYINVRSSYEQYLKDVDKAGEDMKKYAVMNRTGNMTLEEYEDEQDSYEELQNSLFESMKLYTSTLYSFDRLTCGAVSAMLSGTDLDMQTAVVGESYVKKDGKEARYYLKSIIQRELFELSIYIPEDFPTEITDFELWCDNIQVGDRTPKDKSLRHLALTKDKISQVKIRLYNGDEFVDDCVIDPNEESGVLNITTALEIKKEETGVIGTYTSSFSDVTGLLTLTFTPLESEGIKYYRVLASDGTAMGDGKVRDITRTFTHLGLVSGDFSKLKLEFYDEAKSLKYTGYLDPANGKIRKTIEDDSTAAAKG
ncbi:MAG: TolC family protein [Lachnospiraceae bacterium]|nr:TolC family protein [Lachnospiraceae bacterium]